MIRQDRTRCLIASGERASGGCRSLDLRECSSAGDLLALGEKVLLDGLAKLSVRTVVLALRPELVEAIKKLSIRADQCSDPLHPPEAEIKLLPPPRRL